MTAWETALTTVLIPWTVRFLVALAVILVTMFLAKRIKGSVHKRLATTRADRSTTLLVGRIAYISVLTLGVFVVLGVFGLNWTVLVTFVGVISLAISLAIQDVLKSFVAGLYLLVERPFRIGETIKLKDFSGEVEHIGIRVTTLRTEEGFQVVVPNSTVFVEVIVNKSVPGGAPSPEPGHVVPAN